MNAFNRHIGCDYGAIGSANNRGVIANANF